MQPRYGLIPAIALAENRARGKISTVRYRRTPAWWRETRPVPVPVYPGSIHLRGEISQEDIPDFPDRPSDLQGLVIEQGHAQGLTIALDDRHLLACWSEFDDCTFTQRRSGHVLNASGAAAQGTLGWAHGPSVYRRCRFVGVRFKILGGFSMGAAIFEDCVFDRCRFNGHFAYTADLINCRFLGKIDGCTWYGTAPEHDGGRPNDIRGNDFTEAVITPNVGWRGQFDLDRQLWPEGFVPTVDS